MTLRKDQAGSDLPTYMQMLPFALTITLTMATLFALEFWTETLLRGEGGLIEEIAGRYGRNLFWGFAAPVVILFTFRFPLQRPHLKRSITAHVAFYIIFSLVYSIFRAYYHVYLIDSDASWMLQWKITLTRSLNTHLWQYVPAVVTAQLLIYARDLREFHIHQGQLRSQLLEAQLQALRAQLQPHFLFNTLNSILSLVRSNPRQAETTIVRLGHILRNTVENSDTQQTSLGEEVRLVTDYLEIEKTRLGERLHVSMDIPEGLINAAVPYLLLQPLAENAVRHGVAKITSQGEIVIRARQDGDELCISVCDNGPGPARSQRPGGVGLSNTHTRLRHLYGERCQFVLSHREPGGAEVSVRFPLTMIAPESIPKTQYAGVVQ